MNTTFGVGNVLATGFRIWFRNLIPFLLITALLYAPPWIWVAILTHGEPTAANLQAASRGVVVALALGLPLGTLVAATLTYGVVMELHGQRASIGACITIGLARFVPALGVVLLTWLCVMVGVLALVIGSAVVFCMLYVAMPASVLERPGLVGALRRSRELTQGHKWEIFGLLFVLALINFATSFVLRGFTVSTATTVQAALDNLSRTLYVDFAHGVIVGSLGAVMSSVTYVLLRAEKEGTSAAELAKIFD